MKLFPFDKVKKNTYRISYNNYDKNDSEIRQVISLTPYSKENKSKSLFLFAYLVKLYAIL